MRLFVDNLTNLDFSYLHPSRGLVGETWLASIELIGDLDDQGMVCDFGLVKKMLRDWLDTEIDHRLVVASKSSELKSLDIDENATFVNWQTTNQKHITTQAPRESFCLVDCEELSPDTVADWCISKLRPMFPDSVNDIKLNFVPERIRGPLYHYSHGLKKHDGNCQRIAHGHRSKIEIWKDGILDNTLMQEWAERWQDIYIGSEEDISEQDHEKTCFAYTSAQGSFSLSIPTEACYIINTDSTVELIANHIAKTLKSNTPHSAFRVKAYEGIGKGAIVDL